MTTSGLSSFGYDTENNDLITEAFERCGRDASTLSPVELNSAVRSMNLMFADWSNLGPNLFAVDNQQIPLVAGVNSYTIPSDTVDIYQMIVQQGTGASIQQLYIGKISRAEWVTILNKEQPSDRPTQFYLQRTATPVVYFWPVQTGALTAMYWRLRMIENAGSLTQTPDVANRWLDAVCAGLAARLATKYAPDRFQILAGQAKEAYGNAAGEDRETVTMRILPDLSCYSQ